MLPAILIGILALLCVQACVEPGTKVLVEVFYESLCPDSKRFFLEQLNTTYPQLSDIINLELVPYGKATRTLLPNGRTKFDCQHGPEECYGNLQQSCAIHFYPNPKQHLPFVACMFNSPDPTRDHLSCVHKAQFDQFVLDDCAEGKKGNDLQLEYAKWTESVNSRKRLEFVPWIRLNKHDRMYEAFSDLKRAVCKEYKTMLEEACDSESKVQQGIPKPCIGFVN